MARDRDFPEHKPVKVDWSDPELQSLLSKTEHWQLDKRRSYEAQDVHIHLRWDAGMPRDARIVDRHEAVIVLQTQFPLPVGEHVRVDRPSGDLGAPLWGVVIQSRPGTRAEDLAQGSHLHWLRLTDADD